MLTRRSFAPLVFVLASTGSTSILVTACSPSAGTAVDGGAPDALSVVDASLPDVSDAARADAGDSVDAKCGRLFDAAFKMAQRCGARAGAELSSQAYHASDRSNYVASCVSQASAPGYDAARLGACLGEAEATTLCVDFLELSAPFNPSYLFGGPSTLAACLQGPGTLPAGAGCAYGSQCASAHCDTAGSSYCGKCAAAGAPFPAPAAIGQACDVTRPCISGASCIGTCQMPAGDGESCESSNLCALGLACTGMGGAPRICKPRQPLGASCADGLYCLAGLSCIGDQCVKVPIGKAGDDCSFAPGTNVLCDAESTCVANPNPSTRTCISVQETQGQIGDACDLPSSTKACSRSLWCVDHKCQLRDSNRCTAAIADAGTTDAQPKDAAKSD